MSRDLVAEAIKIKVLWTEKDEIGFLKKLGKWSIRDRSDNYVNRRKMLLKRYSEAMRLRKTWDGIDREAVEKYLVGKRNSLNHGEGKILTMMRSLSTSDPGD